MAREFLAWLAVPAGERWLDVGCGTGALSQTIVRHADPERVLGVDASSGYLSYAREQTVDSRVHCACADARSLPISDARFDVVVSGLMLNFVAPPERAVFEMARVVRPKGVVACYVWDYAGGMEMMRCFWDAAAALDPAAHDLDEGVRFPLCKPEALIELFRAGGLSAVESRAIDVPTVFQGFLDYWTPFTGGQGPAPAYVMSLTAEQRAALRDYLRQRLPSGPDGTISLTARAWAVRAHKR
ncbi:MAG TPA: class I SAM-dependent methyltransferase [Dehalococcoidia bacterium]|nr:class I SAM-dependent methyltransferase [Dehalococcoidia bacterium]